MVFALILTTRFLLGVFFASLAGGVSHILAQVILLSFFFPAGSNVVLVSSILGGGIGGSVGGFLGWSSPGGSKWENLTTLALALAGGLAGAGIGVWRGAHAYHLAGLPGIPELAGLIYGAVIGANLFPLAYFIFRRVRSGKFEG